MIATSPANDRCLPLRRAPVAIVWSTRFSYVSITGRLCGAIQLILSLLIDAPGAPKVKKCDSDSLPIRASQQDLSVILDWLKREYQKDGEGFWSNKNLIENSFEESSLWVIRDAGEAVAFQVGDYAADILCVRNDRQRRGLGRAMFEASLVRATENGVNVMRGECSPRSSLPFWKKQGFEPCSDPAGPGPIMVRRVLHREYDLPEDLPSVEVTICFFPQAILRFPDVSALSTSRLSGAVGPGGEIALPRRVIGLGDDEPSHADLVVKLVVDGSVRYFGKAKYVEAEAAGIQRDTTDNAFFTDKILPEITQSD